MVERPRGLGIVTCRMGIDQELKNLPWFNSGIFIKSGVKMTSTAVLQHLKKHGQLLDSEISAMTKIPLDEIRRAIEDLSRRGEISLCSVTRYKNGTPTEGLQCRISGYYPPAAPGRKPSH